jgi:hypothetical protein
MTCITSNKKKFKKITLHFETNHGYQARSYQNSLRYNVITTNNQIKLAGKTNDKYVIT